MQKRTKLLVSLLLAVLLVLSVTVGASATSGTKSISAIFRNIHIIANSKVVPTEAEPFIAGGRTYVPLRAISEALGAWVDWNPATNLVTIKGGTSSVEVADLKAQIAAKDAEIARLKGLDKDNDDDGDIHDLEKEIKRDFDELGDVEIEDISLSGDEDDVDVEIEVDLGDFEDEWDDLTDREIKNWLDDLCGDIQDYFSDDTDIDGEIIDIDSDDTLVDFSKDGDDDIEVDIDSRSADEGDVEDVEDDLLGATYPVEGIDFEIEDVAYDVDNDEIEVILVALDAGADELTDSELEDGGESIAEDIADIFSDDADADADTVFIEFRDEDYSRLGDYEYDV